jgi:predicted RNase H-like HicB family nuclease
MGKGAKEIAITVWLEDPRVEKEGDFYSAYSDQLQLVGCGLTRDEAEQNLKDAITTSLKALLKEGVFKEVLDRKGIIYEAVPIHTTDDNRALKPLLVGV